MSSKYTALSTDLIQWRQRNIRLTYAIIGTLALFLLIFWFHDEAMARYYPSVEEQESQNQGYKVESGGGHDDVSDSVDFGPKDLKKAVNRAEKLWKNNVKKRHAFIKEQGGLEKIREFADKSHGWGQSYTLVLLQSLGGFPWPGREPRQCLIRLALVYTRDIFVPGYPCPWEVERVGRMADGGKYTCGLPRIQQTRGKKGVVYSFGVERESSWEAEILERTDCEIFMYDYSVTKFGPQLEAMDPEMSKRAHFFQIGLGDKDEMKDGKQFHTLTTLMKNNGHDWIDIFKIDVEGAEFKILPDIIAEFGIGRLPFSQMLLEIHAQATVHAYSPTDFSAWWESLEEAGLRAFTSELNYPAIHWNPFPTAMEMNFLNTCNGRAKCGTLLRNA